MRFFTFESVVGRRLPEHGAGKGALAQVAVHNYGNPYGCMVLAPILGNNVLLQRRAVETERNK